MTLSVFYEMHLDLCLFVLLEAWDASSTWGLSLLSILENYELIGSSHMDLWSLRYIATEGTSSINKYNGNLQDRKVL